MGADTSCSSPPAAPPGRSSWSGCYLRPPLSSAQPRCGWLAELVPPPRTRCRRCGPSPRSIGVPPNGAPSASHSELHRSGRGHRRRGPHPHRVVTATEAQGRRPEHPNRRAGVHTFAIAQSTARLGDGRVMADEDLTNTRTSSTTWEWRRVRMSRAPKAMSTSSEASPPKGSLLPWPRRKPLTLSIAFRGGPECWWEVRARGRVWRRPGTVAIHDLMSEIMAWHSGIPPKV